MSRRRFSGGLASGVSLFPFLSVLACVIGTLTLLIAALAVGQVADELTYQSALERDDAARQRADEIGDLEERLRESAEDLQELSRLRLQVSTGPRTGASEGSDAEAQRARQRQLAARLSQLRGRAEKLDESLEQVQAELDALPDEPEPETIQIMPLGAGPPLVAFFAECREAGVRVRSPGGQWSLPLRVPGVAGAPRFKAFVDEARRTRNATVIFLIRPDGVQTYIDAIPYVERANVRHGKLALPGKGALDLSLLRSS